MKKHLLLLGFALAAPSAIYAQGAIGEVFSGDASVRGSVILSANGTRVLSGSQVSAGDGAALVRLERGGDLRICPKTNLSLSADKSGKTLVLGLNAGAMELNYKLGASSDSLITPDFRLQLISPGTFHLALSVTANGDTCLRSLPGNDASVFISEMMSGESYQLSPGKNVMFRAGKISGATEAPAVCGCPDVKVMVATNPEPQAAAAEPTPTSQPEAQTISPSAAQSTPQSATQAANQAAPQAATPTDGKGEAHLEVEGSFVYRGNEAVQDIYTSVSRLSLSKDNSKLTLALMPKVSGPAENVKAPEKKPGILRRIGNFVERFFRG